VRHIDPVRASTLLVTAVVLSACAMFEARDVHHTEDRLAAAGFKMHLADTPAKLAHLQSMPQHTLRPVKRDGTLYYAYADAGGCKCLYLGSEPAYQSYEQIVLDAREVRQEREAAVTNEDAAIINYDATWDAWGMDVW
jgi:hypothetical protein